MAFVESDELSSEEIVSRLDIGRDSDSEFTAILSHSSDAPLLGRGIVSILENLEPNVSRSGLRLGHVDNARSLMTGVDIEVIRASKASLVMPLKGNSRSRFDWALSVSRLSSIGQPAANHVLGLKSVRVIKSRDGIVIFARGMWPHAIVFFHSYSVNCNRGEI